MDYTMKTIKSLKESGLLIKGVSETIKKEANEQRGEVFSMLLGTLSASLLGNLLTGKGVKRSKRPGQGVMTAGEGAIATSQGPGTIRAGQGF